MGKKRGKYIHNLARTIAGQVQFEPTALDPNCKKVGLRILEMKGRHISAIVRKWNPETLGKIASLGLGETSTGECTLSDVYFSRNWLDGSLSGSVLLERIAVTTIIAAMVDNVREDYRKAILGGKIKVAREADEAKGSIVPLPASSVQRPNLDYYDNRRDRLGNEELVPYQGTFGKHR